MYLTPDQKLILAKELDAAPQSKFCVQDTAWMAKPNPICTLQVTILAKQYVRGMKEWCYLVTGDNRGTWFNEDMLFDSKDALINWLSE